MIRWLWLLIIISRAWTTPPNHTSVSEITQNSNANISVNNTSKESSEPVTTCPPNQTNCNTPPLDKQFSHCNCEKENLSKNNCEPECLLWCHTYRPVVDLNNKRCEQSETIPLVSNQTVKGFLALEALLKEQRSHLSSLSKNPSVGCKHCQSPVITKWAVSIMPKEFIKGSCKEEYIKLHRFETKYKASDESLNCDQQAKDHIVHYLSDYTNSILSPFNQKIKSVKEASATLHKECPDGCSFYTNATTTIDPQTCEGYLNLNVYCNHKRKGGLIMNKSEFAVNISYEVSRVCHSLSKTDSTDDKAEQETELTNKDTPENSS